jgi:hypothetical protein
MKLVIILINAAQMMIMFVHKYYGKGGGDLISYIYEIYIERSAHKMNILYDSKCFLCLHEINFLARMDTKGKLMFADIVIYNNIYV